AQDRRFVNLLHRGGLERYPVEVWRPLHVGRAWLPRVAVALGNGKVLPRLVARIDVRVGPAERIRLDGGADRILDLPPRRPEIAQGDRRSVAPDADRLPAHVDVD